MAHASPLRKRTFLDQRNQQAASYDQRVARNAFYYRNDQSQLRAMIPAGADVLDLSCGTGILLEALEPARGVGVDLSPDMVSRCRDKLPGMDFYVGDIEDPSVLAAIDGTFDFLILPDTLGMLDECDTTLRHLHQFCRQETRLVIAHHSSLWEPILTLAEWLGLKTRQPELNWLSSADIEALCRLSDFDPISVQWKQLIPKRLLGLGWLANRLLADLPFVRRLCLRHYVVARSRRTRRPQSPPSVSVVIPCRNERDNVEPAILRTPIFADDQEIIFVEGHSQDGTWEEIQRVQQVYTERRIQALRQPGKGKADAVWTAFEAAKGDLLMILDGDLTVPPETMPKFYRAIVEGHGEFIMGTRMVYPIERDAMRFLNYWANKTFAGIFSWMLRQRITDTLCGTKVIQRRAYRQMKRDVELGKHDPFGDFDLILGAARQNLKIVEIPIRYAARAYGETQISRFRHGFMLLRMVLHVYRRM